MSKVSTSRRIFQIVALFFLLVIFPAGSWYYLKKGFDDHKSTIKDMRDYGAYPQLDLLQDGRPISIEPDSGMIRITAFTDQKSPTELLQLYGRLHEQFDTRGDVELILLYTGQDSLWAVDTGSYSFAIDTSQVRLLSAAGAISESTLQEAFNIPDTANLYGTIALSDLNARIRNFFQYDQEERVKLLVRQTAILMPKRRFNSPSLKREKEK